jgi:hypothetical protein
MVNKRNKEVRVNQLYFIIFFAILHLTAQLYQSKRILAEIKDALSEDNLNNFDETNAELITFCNTALNELRKNFKNNNTLIVAMAKIDAYRIGE